MLDDEGGWEEKKPRAADDAGRGNEPLSSSMGTEAASRFVTSIDPRGAVKAELRRGFC